MYPQREFGHGLESHEETSRSRLLGITIFLRRPGPSLTATL
jgi:hypothetical protein